MAGNFPAVRFVRCPKCHKVLVENAEVPVYKCGGCGTTLRAKMANVEEGMSSGSLESNSQNLSKINLLSKETCNDACNSIVANNSYQEGEISDRLEKGISPVRSEEATSKPEKKIQAEKFFNTSPNDCDHSLRSSDEIEQFSESDCIHAAISQENMKFAESSHSYYGSSTSPDTNRENRVVPKYLLLSKRTFKHKKVLDSVDTTIGKETKVQCQKLPEKSSNKDEFPRGPRIHAIERDTTFGSKNFHSVQNWIGSENEETLKSLPKPPRPEPNVNSLEPDHMKILKKVDELRDELSGFLAKALEEKRSSHLMKHQISPRVPFSGPPHPRNIHYKKLHTEDNSVKGQKLQIKSYSRPVSGGAPFVICYKCWELLQLPADFLVTRKKSNKLKCGACSELLVFSFRPRDRNATPITPHEAQHPPTEADDQNDRVQWDPVSYSGNYGISFERSYCSEAKPVLNVSRNSSYSVKDSRLHRLMGYSSASELLFQPRGSETDEVYQSREPSTPRFNRPLEKDMWSSDRSSLDIGEEDEQPQERLRARRKVTPLKGLLKKGVRELSHGIESMKMKLHSNG